MAMIQSRDIYQSQEEESPMDDQIQLPPDVSSSFKKQSEIQLDPGDKKQLISTAPKHSTFTRPRTYCYLSILGLLIIFSILSYFSLLARTVYSGSLSKLLPIYAGQIHYSRIPFEYWQNRLELIKSMGLNSVSVYVMWNFHENRKSEFDYQTENKNLSQFLNLAQKHNLSVLLRPGPYVCAEWDFGGLPARLLGIDGLQIRSANKLYERQVLIYFQSLAPIIRKYLSKNGGNIIMIQIQNQYGYFSSSPEHTQNLITMWKSLDIQCEFYYQDPGKVWKTHYWERANIGVSETNHLLKYYDIDLSPMRSKNGLVFGGQVYSGWFTSWGWRWGGRNEDQFAGKILSLIKNNRSFSIYMAFGGTNFNLTAGANGFNLYSDYMPHITSYDYDSPITQQGQPTSKFHKIRGVFAEYSHRPLYQVPELIKANKLADLNPVIIGNLWDNLVSPHLLQSETVYFEHSRLQMYHQGIVLYETVLEVSRQYSFSIIPRDFGIVYLNGQLVSIMDRRHKVKHKINLACRIAPCKLAILIEAMGHINFGEYQGKDRKGLIEFKDKDRKQDYAWNITKLPIDSNILAWPIRSSTYRSPLLFQAHFLIEKEPKDCYLDLSKYTKGYAWLNGRLLGRYWNIGPQQRLYVPGVWMKQGTNTVHIFELLSTEPHTISSYESLK